METFGRNARADWARLGAEGAADMILGFSGMILSSPEFYGDDIPPKLLADLQVIQRNSQHLSSLIDDVLDLSQIDANRMALNKERVSIKEVIEEAATAVKPLFQSKGLYLELAIPSSIPEIWCDRTRIREVLLNLLSNAGRFTEKGGVSLQVSQVSEHIDVSVTDTGMGISTSDQARLFKPFQQANHNLGQKYGGSGLGLSISKAFIELHDGKMWVESERKGYYIHLPASNRPHFPSNFWTCKVDKYL